MDRFAKRNAENFYSTERKVIELLLLAEKGVGERTSEYTDRVT